MTIREPYVGDDGEMVYPISSGVYCSSDLGKLVAVSDHEIQFEHARWYRTRAACEANDDPGAVGSLQRCVGNSCRSGR